MPNFKIFYRYDNLKRDVLAKKDMLDSYFGITIPATTAIYYKNSVKTFLQNVGKSYIIDPMSYFLTQNANVILNNNGQPRRSYKMLLEEYLHMNEDDLNQKIETEETFLSNLTETDLKDLCKNIITFQKEVFSEDEFSDSLGEYFDIEELDNDSDQIPGPDFLITPYVLIDSLEKYELNRKLIKLTQEIIEIEDPPLYLAFCFSKKYIKQNPQFEDWIIRDFPIVSHFLLWYSDFNPSHHKEPLKNMLRMKEIIQTINPDGEKEVINLYASYLSLLFSKIGLTGMSSGLSGGNHKRAKLSTGGGGGRAKKVYVSELHSELLEEDYKVLIRTNSNLVCNCIKCEELKQGLDHSDDSFIRNYQNNLLAEKNHLEHFIYCRNEEKNNIENSTLDELISDLNQKSSQYEDTGYAIHV